MLVQSAVIQLNLTSMNLRDKNFSMWYNSTNLIFMTFTKNQNILKLVQYFLKSEISNVI